MDREEINRALCKRIGAKYHPPIEGEGTWRERARRLEVLGEAARGGRRLDYLQVSRSGNFGNNYIQLVHAMALAEARGVRRVLHRFDHFGSHRGWAGPRLSQRKSMPPDKTGLAGTYFLRAPFADLCDLAPSQFLRVSDAYVRPALSIEPPARQKGVVVLNLRGGADVFENPSPNPLYGQPPLSYFQRALANLAEKYVLAEVNLVHQDVRNPVLEPLVIWLQSLGVPWRVTSSGLLGDAAAIMAAEHIVMGWTTFTAALAVLSPNMRTVTVFRKAPLFDEMCVAAEGAFMVSDAEGGYFPTDGWLNNAAQREMMIDYPVAALTLEDQAVRRWKLIEKIRGYEIRRRARLRRLLRR